jgi:hypothetical protein
MLSSDDGWLQLRYRHFCCNELARSGAAINASAAVSTSAAQLNSEFRFALLPQAQKRPAVTLSWATVITRPVIRTIKCTVAINPSRHGTIAPQPVALPAFFANDPGIFHRSRTRCCQIGLTGNGHRESRRREHCYRRGRQRQTPHRARTLCKASKQAPFN